MYAAAQSAPDSMSFAASGNKLALLRELKLVLQQAQSGLLRGNLEEIFANTARLKAIIGELRAPAKGLGGNNLSQTMQTQANSLPEITELQSEIRSESLLYESLVRRKQRTAGLLSRMLSNATVTYSPQPVGH